MSPDDATDGAGNTGRFLTTRWSLILSSVAGEGEEEKAREALAQLCRIYWRPIFAFICRHGNTLEDAQDLTQDFFLMILKGDLLQRANADRGRFRSLLLKSLQNFLIDSHAKAHARKRGGDLQFVQRRNQRLLIDRRAAREVENGSGRLHRRQFCRSDHLVGIGR